MKLFLIIFIFLITGCSNETSIIKIADEHYNVAIPYKIGVSNNYIINNMNAYDVDEVESSLMEISLLYFSKDNSFYQDGQYLDNDYLKDILSKEKLNNYEEFEIDKVKIDPYYLTGIIEQNYLDSKNELKGISLGLILNPYQAYKNSSGIVLYKELEKDKILQIGNEISKKLLEELRNIKELSKTKIMIALYLQGDPNSSDKGSYVKYGITTNNEVKFNDYKEMDYYITSEYVLKNNNDIYNLFNTLEKKLKETFPRIYITGNCKYVFDKIDNIYINITSSSLSKSEVLFISQIIEDIISNNSSSSITIYIKENNNIKAIIEKKKNRKINTHILEGI